MPQGTAVGEQLKANAGYGVGNLHDLQTLRVQVPSNHILTQNLYCTYYYPKPKYLNIGYLDPLGLMTSKALQFAKAALPMLVTESGISKRFKAVQPSKAHFPIVVTEFGIATSCKVEHVWKACSLMLAVPAGISTKTKSLLAHWDNGKKMENHYSMLGLCWGYIWIMEKKMETTNPKP